MKKHHLILVAATLLSAMAYADDFSIGLTGAFSGGSAALGAPMREGVRMAVDEINAAGGIGGKRISLVERDDEAKPTRGLEIAKELTSSKRVCSVIGFSNTGVALAAHRVYQESKVPVIVAVSAGTAITKQFEKPEFGGNYIFRNSQNDERQVVMLVKEAIDNQKRSRIAILADSTNYGQLGREDLIKELGKRGIKPVTDEKFNVKDVDMTAQLLHAREAKADIVITYGIGPELAQIANGLEKLGWKVPLLGGVPMSMGNFIQNAGKNAEGARMPVLFVEDPVNPKRSKFIDDYLRRNGGSSIPSAGFVAQGYDAAYLMAAAIKQAKTCNGEAIKTALESLAEPVQGVIATYTKPFSPSNHEVVTASSDIPIMGEVKGGKIVFADPMARTEALRKSKAIH